MYHIFDVSSTKGLEESFILPEWQFIQYVLPCFVTQMGQLATNSKIKPNELHSYTQFVHNLIQSFELNLITKFVRGNPGAIIRRRAKDIPDWVCMNIAENLEVQLQELQIDLGLLIYGSYKRMKKVDPTEVLLGQICFRLLKTTLSTTTLNKSQPVIFRCWGETLLQCVPRMRASVTKVVLLQTNPFPTNNLIRALALLQELTNIAAACSIKPLDELIYASLDLANKKLKFPSMGTSRSNLDKKLSLEMQKLTVPQLLSVVLFSIVISGEKNSSLRAISTGTYPLSYLMDMMPVKGTMNFCMLKFLKATNMFRATILDDAVKKYEAQDWRGLRSLLTPLLIDDTGLDLSTVTMDFAKKSASACYGHILDVIKAKDCIRKQFLNLLPVIPIKYCRCCEKFEAELSKCKVCVDNGDFPDIHWFCSQECETKVLAEGHLEEHDSFLMKQLGLI